MSVAFGGLNEMTATFKVNEEIEKGTPVAMSGNNTVSACSDGGVFCGFCTDSDSSYAGVQLCGTVTVKYTGTAPQVGFAKLAANATGGVKTSNSGREFLVLCVDSTNSTVTFLM